MCVCAFCSEAGEPAITASFSVLPGDIECVPNAECSTSTLECTCKPGHYTERGKCFPFKDAGDRCDALGQCTDFAECSSATTRGVCACLKGYYNEAG